ncbi:hypothetical protein JOC77_001549 [Peribacillus deserti]|uniref:Uncharacterized protein n=1 Tax=Peribacillus deserti TaxID=673318 RepID=A0ABS2QG47_9BACI|nr:hypothetical protein [Peribacillus deserti]
MKQVKKHYFLIFTAFLVLGSMYIFQSLNPNLNCLKVSEENNAGTFHLMERKK